MEMESERRTAIIKDYDAFVLEMQAAESNLDLEPDVAKFLELSRKVAFQAGWNAGQHWQEHRDAEAPTVRCTAPRTVRTLIGIGERAWVQPLAIVEHMATGDLFVDPRFTVSPQPTDRCCIELVVTSDGLVASGPADRHRLSPEIDRERLRPLLRFDVVPVG